MIFLPLSWFGEGTGEWNGKWVRNLDELFAVLLTKTFPGISLRSI